MSQTGTTRRATRGFLLLGALLGCAQDETGTGTPLENEQIGQKDAETAKDDDASAIKSCTDKAAEFVAAHSACTSDSDCVIVGDCSHANFQAVAKDAADEARALVLACAAQDGPTYAAVCRANKCERVATGQSCGQASPQVSGCEVELVLTLGADASAATVSSGASTELKLWLKNHTDHAIELAFDVPCHGPRISGLGGYDVWNSCVAGACQTDPVATTVSLAAGEKLLWRGAVLAADPSTCNAAGLPAGDLALSFALANVTGAKTCGPTPATLISAR